MSSDLHSPRWPSPHDSHLLTQRRIRHITSIQIRNLTPFPLRDAVTSALSQPPEPSRLTEATDDLGATVTKRRPRKSSSNSVTTRRSMMWDDAPQDNDPLPNETRGRTVSFSKDPTIPPTTGLGQSYASSRSSHSLRAHRRRTNSMASSISNALSISVPPFTTSTSSNFPTSAFLPNHSQTLLENVIESRLVETFITLTFPNAPPPPDTPRTSMFSPSMGVRSPITPRTPISTTGTQKPPKATTKVAKEASVSSPAKSKFPSSTPAPPKKVPPKLPLSPTQSLPPRLNGAGPGHKKAASAVSLGTPVEPELPKEEFPPTPSFFSPIHRPSTNPQFPLDVRATKDIPPTADTAAHVFKAELWGRTVRTDPSSSIQSKDDEWRLLYEWDVDMMKLEPLPDDVDHPVHLPSNTMVVTLSPPGQSFYLPQPEYVRRQRPPTPTVGYTSDPESGVSRAKREHTSDIALPSPALPSLSRRRRPAGSRPESDPSGVKSANWQDLFKLATLQSLIQDNESSLNDVIAKIDDLLKEDELSMMKREISQRELRVQELHEARSRIFQESEQKRQEIVIRSTELKDRVALLSAAQEALDESEETGLEEEISVTRHKLLEVEQNMTCIRTSLISALTSIFPIELLSPPDLLFTILDAPLPIPLTTNDPAPPLSLPEFREVTEDTVATALGHAAQVVNILAAYMGKTLVYPVTCVGSRSLVRDGISSMVGPRMFPLFSKGVDTYRFEYGVFLLNKDIEMLMSERDLRAMDMRHTLPNLKNLLLTLSHDDATVKAETARRPLLRMTSLSLTGLETPSESRSESPIDGDVNTPRASHTREPSGEGNTPTASGATTPTLPSVRDESRKSKLLGFVGLPEFLRTRYTSTSQAGLEAQGSGSGKAEEDGENGEDNGSVDEADRVTIHGG